MIALQRQQPLAQISSVVKGRQENAIVSPFANSIQYVQNASDNQYLSTGSFKAPNSPTASSSANTSPMQMVLIPAMVAMLEKNFVVSLKFVRI